MMYEVYKKISACHIEPDIIYGVRAVVSGRWFADFRYKKEAIQFAKIKNKGKVKK